VEPEEVEPEEVHDWRKCMTGGSARAEGVYDWRKWNRRKCMTGGSARAEGVYERRECAGGGRAE